MKRVFGILSLGIVLASANVSFAQDQPVKDKIEKQPRIIQVDKAQHRKLTPEQKQKFMEDRKATFSKELDLSEKEADKYFQIQKDFRSKVQKLQEERKSLRETLKTSDQLSDKDLKKNVDRLNAIDVELAKLKADKFDKEVSAIGVRKATKAQDLKQPRVKHGPKVKGDIKRGTPHRAHPNKKDIRTQTERPVERK